jgi:hypothetical protein
MEAQALQQPRPFAWRRRLLVLALVLGVAVTGATSAGYVWLQGYEPLGTGSSYGAGVHQGVMVPAPFGSDGVDVFFPKYRPHATFHVETSIANRGRFPVTVLGLGDPGTEVNTFRAVRAQVSPANAVGLDLSPLDSAHPLQLQPGSERSVTITYRLASKCIGGQPPGYWKTSTSGTAAEGFRATWFRIRYAKVFEKTQQVALPFAITLVCRNGLAPAG